MREIVTQSVELKVPPRIDETRCREVDLLPGDAERQAKVPPQNDGTR